MLLRRSAQDDGLPPVCEVDFGDGGGDGVEQFANALAMLGTYGKDLANAEAAEVFRCGCHGIALNLIYGQKDGFAAAQEHADEVVVGAGQFGADVHHQDQRIGFIQGDFGLAVDLLRDQFRVVGDDAAGVNQAEAAPGPVVFAVDAVAGDARLVAHDGAAAAG